MTVDQAFAVGFLTGAAFVIVLAIASLWLVARRAR